MSTPTQEALANDSNRHGKISPIYTMYYFLYYRRGGVNLRDSCHRNQKNSGRALGLP